MCMLQWAGNAASGMADVVYLLAGGVQHGILLGHEQPLLRSYWEALDARLREAGKGPYSW